MEDAKKDKKCSRDDPNKLLFYMPKKKFFKRQKLKFAMFCWCCIHC